MLQVEALNVGDDSAGRDGAGIVRDVEACAPCGGVRREGKKGNKKGE